MLTSRDMWKEAAAVYYSSNRLTILPQRSLLSPESELGYGTSQATNDATFLFLKRVQPALVAHIRTLEIIFPRLDFKASVESAYPPFLQWCQAVEDLHAHAQLQNLTVIIHFWQRPFGALPDDYLKGDDSTPLLAKMLVPLKSLVQMRRLFIHLDYPSHWSPPRLLQDISKQPRKPSPGCLVGEHFIPQAHRRITEAEGKLERLVMGAGYHSSSRGKADMLPSPSIRKAWDGL